MRQKNIGTEKEWQKSEYETGIVSMSEWEREIMWNRERQGKRLEESERESVREGEYMFVNLSNSTFVTDYKLDEGWTMNRLKCCVNDDKKT